MKNFKNVSEIDLGKKIIIPGFIDGHAHAPQYSFVGIGMHLDLMKWLDTYTFPAESKFKDIDFARNVYTRCVNRHLKNGSTTVSWFATIHLEATKVLCEVADQAGMRAFVGKVNMDRNSPDF